MRLTKKEIAEFRDAWGSESKVNALCDMADELLDTHGDDYWKDRADGAQQRADAWKSAHAEISKQLADERDNWKRRAESSEALMDNNIRDLRDICETLAKRIAALEGKPHTFDGIERRRYWVADRRQREPVYMSSPVGHYTHYSTGQHWADNRRQGPKDRRGVMTCTYGRAFWRQADKGYVMQDERKRQRRIGAPWCGEGPCPARRWIGTADRRKPSVA